MKSLNEYGVLLKEEASYNAGGTVAAATDGVLVLEQPTPAIAHAHQGQRRGERGPMNVGIKRARKGGRSGSVSLVHEFQGAGEAYSAAKKPSVHTLLRLAGFDAALDTTVDAEKYTYTLGAGASGVGEIYTRAQKYALQAAYADLTISGGDGPPSWEFPLSFLGALPAEAAVPAITYPNLTVDPPITEGMVLSMGDFATAVVREWSLSLGREIAPRINRNATSAGHAGFASGRRALRFEVLVEAIAFDADPFHSVDGMNPYELAERATALALAWQIGSEQYNQCKFIAANAQLAEDIAEEEDGPTALWRLVWELQPSTPALRDNISIVCD